MSNSNLFFYLEKNYQDYKARLISVEKFVAILNSHITALEGIPYSVLLELRNMEYDFELHDYFDEEYETNPEIVFKKFEDWLDDLKLKYSSL